MNRPSAAHDDATGSIAAILARHGVRLTIGGEPTFVPVEPVGAEWNHAAVGPTKLASAWKVAEHLLTGPARHGTAFFSPGKCYPGELDPRWAIWIVMRRDGSPLLRASGGGEATGTAVASFRAAVAAALGVDEHWREFADPRETDGDSETWAVLLDRSEQLWTSAPWPEQATHLTAAFGPAGLRLPLHLLPEGVPRRAMVVERRGGTVAVFLPPLLQRSFVELLAAVEAGLDAAGLATVQLQGGLPADEMGVWRTIGLSADPGVLEINLPACEDWREYDAWMHAVTEAAEANGLRAWREPAGGMPEETGGGNHLLWGGPAEDENPFFTRPGWVASILRYWHEHPSLAYAFTGRYVGKHSQAPRADESGWEAHDLDWAWSFLESLPAGDQRTAIAETIRHLQTDVTGNGHRSEICFDKFWSPGRSSVPPGLLEFRAIGTLPRAGWSAAVALLWLAAGVRLLDHPCRDGPRAFGRSLHDRCLLPSGIWDDLRSVLADVAEAGMPLDEGVYRDIWNWRFPSLLEFRDGDARLTVRQALEPWPLLSDVPLDGSTTSRFIDTSLHRLELVANDAFVATWQVCIAGRRLPLGPASLRYGSIDGERLAGLRYRRSRLYPSLHPGIPCHWPLELDLVGAGKPHRFVLSDADARFQRAPATAVRPHPPEEECRPLVDGDVTFDLRVDRSGRETWSA